MKQVDKVLPRIPYEKLDPQFVLKDIEKFIPDKDTLMRCVNEAVKKEELIPVCGDVYLLGNSVNHAGYYCLDVAAILYDPDSYVSGYSALRFYDWIPECFVNTWLVTKGKTNTVETKDSYLIYHHISQRDYTKGVKTIDCYGYPLRQATPLKAIADTVAWLPKNLQKFSAIEILEDDMRIEEENYKTLTAADFDEVQGNYPNYPNTEQFLAELRKELKV